MLANGTLNGVALHGAHDPRFDVLIEGVDGHRLLANGEGGRADHRRKLSGEARTVQRPFAFEQRLAARHFLAVVTGHGLDDRLSLSRTKVADMFHRLP
ncbi:hypothetical protein D9M71_493330 [compost metagenome]